MEELSFFFPFVEPLTLVMEGLSKFEACLVSEPSSSKGIYLKTSLGASLEDKKVEPRLNLSLLWNWYGLEKKKSLKNIEEFSSARFIYNIYLYGK